MPRKKTAAKRGPKPETLKIEGNWKDAARKVMRTPTPEGGWPKKDGWRGARGKKPKSA